MTSTDRHSAGFARPPLPVGFDDSRAAERARDPAAWALDDDVQAALAQVVDLRRDIRRFRADPVPDAALDRILAAAHRAPSVGLSQPWRFVVVRSQVTRLTARHLAERERLRQAPQLGPRAREFLDQKIEGVSEAPVSVCVCCLRDRPPERVLGRATMHDTDLYSTACAIQNLWLTARAEGLGVGWVSFFRTDDLRRLLGMPAAAEPIAWLCVGYPDERPTRPGLEAAGWASRGPVASVVYDERWPQREGEDASAAPVGASRHRHPDVPASVAALAAEVRAAEHGWALDARDHSDRLVKPRGSLGLLETLVERWSASAGEPPPQPLRAAILVFAADHGVAQRGTSLFGTQVSAQVAAAAARNETAIGVLAAGHGHRLVVADVGLAGSRVPGVADVRVRPGTADLTQVPAMSEDECVAAMRAGARLAGDVLQHTDCLVPGEIGIGNTTAASALLAAMTGLPPDAVCGRGTGLDAAGLARKRDAITAALRHTPAPAGPFRALQRLGGLELAAIAGAMLAAGALRRPVVLDGFAVGVVALAAVRLAPALREHLIAGHRSAEPAHDAVLTELGLEPLLDIRLRLGEASGAALALSLIQDAGRLHRQMGTFADTGIDALG